MKREPVKDHTERKRVLALIERCEKEQTMSMISELVDRLRTESKSMGKYGVDYMATLLARSADTIEMLSKKARADTLQSCFHCDHYEPKGWCNLFEDTVSPNYKCCSEFAEIKPYEYEIKALHKDYQEPYCEIADAPQIDYKDGEEYLRGYKQGIEDEINKHHVGR